MTRLRLVVLLMTLTASFAQVFADSTSRPGWLGFGFTYHRQGQTCGWLQIRRVLPKGPASLSGLEAQDVVTAINGKEICANNDLEVLEVIGRARPGQKMKLTVRRQGKEDIVVIQPIKMTDEQYLRWKANFDAASSAANRQRPTQLQ